MGMTSNRAISLASSTQDMLSDLGHAEELFWADLALTADRGSVTHIREAAVHLALIGASQTSLGSGEEHGPVLSARLLGKMYALSEKGACFDLRLDVSSAITLQTTLLAVATMDLLA